MWGPRRLSSSTVARPCQGISSWRIISSSRRAVDGQCTRRRSSPISYCAQGVEVLAGAPERGGVVGAGVRVVAEGVGERRDAVDRGVHGELGRGRQRRLDGRQAERVGQLDLERADGRRRPVARWAAGRRRAPPRPGRSGASRKRAWRRPRSNGSRTRQRPGSGGVPAVAQAELDPAVGRRRGPAAGAAARVASSSHARRDAPAQRADDERGRAGGQHEQLERSPSSRPAAASTTRPPTTSQPRRVSTTRRPAASARRAAGGHRHRAEHVVEHLAAA